MPLSQRDLAAISHIKQASKTLSAAEQAHKLTLLKAHSAALFDISRSSKQHRKARLEKLRASYKKIRTLQGIRDAREFVKKGQENHLITPVQAAQLNKALDIRMRGILSKSGYSKLSNAQKVRIVVIYRLVDSRRLSPDQAAAQVKALAPAITGDWKDYAVAASSEPTVAAAPEVAAATAAAPAVAVVPTIQAKEDAAAAGIQPSASFVPATTADVQAAYAATPAATSTAPASDAAGTAIATAPVAAGAPSAPTAVTPADTSAAADEALSDEDALSDDASADDSDASEDAATGHNYVLYGGVILAGVTLWYLMSRKTTTVVVH